MYPLLLGGAATLALALLYGLRRKRKSAEELEKERRQWIDTVGRITDGTVIDVHEISSGADASAQMLIYQYDVAGVSYEASYW